MDDNDNKTLDADTKTIDRQASRKKMKFKVDAIDDEASFDGEYEITESESASEEESEEEDVGSPRRQSRNKLNKKSTKKITKIDKPHIVMNVSGRELY